MQLYDEMARYYDLIYSDAYDAEFYIREAKEAKGKVLEVACGTGRILLRLLSEGVDAQGLDSSKGMLEELKRKADQAGLDPRVIHGDMRDFKLQDRFKLIIIPYRSILHLENHDKVIAIRNIASHLEKDGRIILHTYNPDMDSRKMTGGFHPADSEECETPEGRKYVIDWFMEYSPAEDSGRYKIELRFDDDPGNWHEFAMKLFFISKDQMEAMLRSAGLGDIRLYCGFDYSVYNPECREVLWIARK